MEPLRSHDSLAIHTVLESLEDGHLKVLQLTAQHAAVRASGSVQLLLLRYWPHMGLLSFWRPLSW